MKILKVHKQYSHVVFTDEDDYYPEYIRYDAKNWGNCIGEAIEPIYYQKIVDELEEAYQIYKNERIIKST